MRDLIIFGLLPIVVIAIIAVLVGPWWLSCLSLIPGFGWPQAARWWRMRTGG